MDLHEELNQSMISILYKPERNIGFHWITFYILYKTIAEVEYYFDVPHLKFRTRCNILLILITKYIQTFYFTLNFLLRMLYWYIWCYFVNIG